MQKNNNEIKISVWRISTQQCLEPSTVFFTLAHTKGETVQMPSKFCSVLPDLLICGFGANLENFIVKLQPKFVTTLVTMDLGWNSKQDLL